MPFLPCGTAVVSLSTGGLRRHDVLNTRSPPLPSRPDVLSNVARTMSNMASRRRNLRPPARTCARYKGNTAWQRSMPLSAKSSVFRSTDVATLVSKAFSLQAVSLFYCSLGITPHIPALIALMCHQGGTSTLLL